MLKATNVRQVLKQEFEKRREKNTRYSLRSFARDLSLTSSQLSKVFNGLAGLSQESAAKIAKTLQYNNEETSHFINLVNREYSRSKLGKHSAHEKLIHQEAAFTPLQGGGVHHLQKWYYLPLMCLTGLRDFREDSEWIARKIKMPESEVLPAIEHLIEIKMLARDRDEKLEVTGEYFSNAKGLPNLAVRRFHRQFLKKAADALEEQNTHERYLSTIILSVDDDEMSEAQMFIKNFLSDFRKKFCNESTQKKQVYSLGVQYFGLTDLTLEEGNL